jgi:hypothetical protein
MNYRIHPVICTSTYWNTADSVLANVWYDLYAEDKLKDLFYDDSITTLDAWLGWIKMPFNFPVLCLSEKDVVAIAWLNNLDYKTARCHFAFIGDFHRDAGKTILKYWEDMISPEDGKKMFKTLYGVTPERNELAVRVIKVMGFTILGTIPNFCKWHGESVGGVVSYYEIKED